MHSIGAFEITSGKIRVTDPCYDRDTWCSGTFVAKNGKWFAYIETDRGEGRVSQIRINHVDFPHREPFEILTHEGKTVDVSVDSGQAGFFDEEHYPQGDVGEYGEPGFYGDCCKLTLDDGGGTLPFGAVSPSGYGDGGYECRVARDYDDGKVIAALIDFIPVEEEEDYYESSSEQFVNSDYYASDETC